ncbi:LPXTG cell wall anchor domain-containing protein [Streptococcus merionis]|uniref:LPXTG cell wall anchor domain-containing protein n=1 Tax=Streptococcus merionis TaxID=400065 RepID=UPI003513C505
MKKTNTSYFLLATAVLQLAQPYMIKAEEQAGNTPAASIAVAANTAEPVALAQSGDNAVTKDVSEAAEDQSKTNDNTQLSEATTTVADSEKKEEKTGTKAATTEAKSLKTLDDSKIKTWIEKHQFQFVQTLFRTDGESKEIHANVDGYQAPFDLTGYTYLSSIITTTDKGPALVHIYRDASYIDKTIVRTEYYDGTSGKKIQDDQKGQVFAAKIGDRNYYYDVIVEENGEKVYKIFYMTEQDFINYGGSNYYVRLTDYTRFIDQATGQEIATQQEGFIPIYDVSGYTFASAEIVEKDGVSYFVQSFTKNGTTEKETGEVSKQKPLNQNAVAKKASSQVTKAKSALPSTGEVASVAGFIGLGLLAILAIFGISRRRKK